MNSPNRTDTHSIGGGGTGGFFIYCFNSQNYSMLGASAFNPPKKENSQKKDKRQHPLGLTSFRQQGIKHTTEVLQTTKMSAEVA